MESSQTECVMVLCDFSTIGSRPLVVPAIFSRTMYGVMYGVSHPLSRATLKLIINKNSLEGLAHTCGQCSAPPTKLRIPITDKATLA